MVQEQEQKEGKDGSGQKSDEKITSGDVKRKHERSEEIKVIDKI